MEMLSKVPLVDALETWMDILSADVGETNGLTSYIRESEFFNQNALIFGQDS